jgi:hypothetical protein
MHDLNSDNRVLEEIYAHHNYLDDKKAKSSSRKYYWQKIEILKEKMKLQKELEELRSYV